MLVACTTGGFTPLAITLALLFGTATLGAVVGTEAVETTTGCDWAPPAAANRKAY